MTQPLGRRVPTDWTHVDKYPLTLAATPQKNVPVVIGVNWYSDFDDPIDEAGNAWDIGRKPIGAWWVGRDPKNLGYVRGGHCVCLKPKKTSATAVDNDSWWKFYNQGTEGACVGFGVSRMMTILNRKRYFARWMWDRAKEVDEWTETNPGDGNGTSVRAALDVLRKSGHVTWKPSYEFMNTDGDGSDAYPRSGLFGNSEEGIVANRWARDVTDVSAALGYTAFGYVDILNSWGQDWPHVVRMPLETLEVLLHEDGEMGIVTDR